MVWPAYVMVVVVPAQLLSKIYVKHKIIYIYRQLIKFYNVIKKIALTIFSLLLCSYCFAQHSDESGNLKQLNFYQDSLKKLGHALINNENELERKNANYKFLSTLASALKTPNSFLFPFDSVKAITLVNS